MVAQECRADCETDGPTKHPDLGYGAHCDSYSSFGVSAGALLKNRNVLIHTHVLLHYYQWHHHQDGAQGESKSKPHDNLEPVLRMRHVKVGRIEGTKQTNADGL
jgi:hypothetical protein